MPPQNTLFLTFLLLLFISSLHRSYSLNLTAILSHYPDLSDFTTLLSSSGISSDVSLRSSLTILALPNSLLRRTSSPPSADSLRYHILLQYLSFPDLRRIQPQGSLIPTLLQTTGRAPNNLGSLNATFDPESGSVSFHPPNNSSSSSKSNITTLVKNLPFNLSIFTVDAVLEPEGFDLMTSETRPPPPGLNISKALLDGHAFNVAASMLLASGVVDEFERDEGGAGITLFVPTDSAFANLPTSVQLQALSADKKALVLKFHVLHSYYPLGSLESIVNPVQPTLATEDNGAGSFTLNISRVNGSVAINTGIVQAVVTQTVFDQNPVAIFGLSHVLLPKEIFGDNSEINLRNGSGSGGGPYVGAQPPDVGPAPENEPDAGPSHLSSPPGFRAGTGAWASSAVRHSGGKLVLVYCIGLLLYVLV